MADNAGFLEQLGIPSTDERAILEAQRAEIRQRAGYASNHAAGQQARPLLIGGLNALGGILKGERGIKAIGSNFSQGVHTETDRQVAMAAGIAPEVLKSRREIRTQLGKESFGDPEAFETQISMAKKVAQIALKNGDSTTYGKAIASLSSLRTQQTEFEKLQASTKKERTESEVTGLMNASLDGNPVTGTFAQEVDDNGELQNGLILADKQGSPFFKPFGEDLHMQLKGTQSEPLDQRLRKSTPGAELADIRTLARDSIGSLDKFDRVITNVRDLSKAGRAGAVLDKSGAFLGGIDNAVRGVRGVVGSFFPSGGAARDNAEEYSVDSRGNGTGVRTWMNEEANDPASAIWDHLQLPQGVREDAAAAQAYRAQIMELAYMAARLAEPSNRGLSDNDIKNALIRLGSSANPQVIMTRFAEILGDAANELDNALSTHHGRFFNDDGTRVSNDQIDLAIGGDAITIYRAKKAAFQQKHSLRYDSVGRAHFLENVDVSPHDSISRTTGGAPEAFEKPVEEMSIDEAADLLIGRP